MSVERFIQALKGRSELEITVKGRRTEKEHSVTVWFVHKENRIYLLPVKGSNTEWYKNLLKDPNITLTVDGRLLRVKAEPVTKPDRVQRVIEIFAEKYGGISEIRRWYSKLDVAVEIPLII